jgi:AraC family transcriptional regulator of adaptative response / DNA-3-methyladenine glycosylase II
MADNPNLLDPGDDIDAALARLKEIPGIGEWTAQYLAMRAFSWPDAFPATDLGIRKALGIGDERRILERAEAWRPWRGYAAMHLWRTLA